MTIMPSLPNIFDPKILLDKKDERITDLMGNNEYVLIRENVTTIASHKVFFRESIPRSNVTSNGLTVVLLHDKHTEATGGTGCCSGLWVSLSGAILNGSKLNFSCGLEPCIVSAKKAFTSLQSIYLAADSAKASNWIFVNLPFS